MLKCSHNFLFFFAELWNDFGRELEEFYGWNEQREEFQDGNTIE
jgi:hypothetical protein